MPTGPHARTRVCMWCVQGVALWADLVSGTLMLPDALYELQQRDPALVLHLAPAAMLPSRADPPGSAGSGAGDAGAGAGAGVGAMAGAGVAGGALTVAPMVRDIRGGFFCDEPVRGAEVFNN